MKKIASLILAVALMMAMAAIPAMAEGETEATEYKYQVRGIRNGDVIVANEETSRRISIVTAATADDADTSPVAAKKDELTKVEFYGDNDVLLDTVEYPYEYTLKFDSKGEHTLKTIVYYTDDADQSFYEVFESTYNVMLGTVKTGNFNAGTGTSAINNNPYSYEENFDNAPSDGDDTAFNNKDIVALPWVNSCPSAITPTYADGKLTLVSNAAGKYLELKCFGQNTETDVIYYSMDVEADQAFAWYGYIVKDSVKLYPFASDCHLDIIVDLNSKCVIFKHNGEENRRYNFANATSLSAKGRLRLYFDKNRPITLDNIKCTAYDIDETQDFGTIGELAGDTYTNEIAVTAEDIERGSMTVATRAMNTTDDNKTLTNIIAVYDGYNRLITAPTVDKDISYASGAFGEKEYPVALPADAAKVRIFTFDSLGTLVPVKAWQSAN